MLKSRNPDESSVFTERNVNSAWPNVWLSGGLKRQRKAIHCSQLLYALLTPKALRFDLLLNPLRTYEKAVEMLPD